MSSHNLYEVLAADIDYDAVRQFILEAEEQISSPSH
jgi:hypothetical protein